MGSRKKFVMKFFITLVGLCIGYLAYFRLAMSDYWLVAYAYFYLAPPVVAVLIVLLFRR